MFELTIDGREWVATLEALRVALEVTERRISGWRYDPEMVEILERDKATQKAIIAKLEALI